MRISQRVSVFKSCVFSHKWTTHGTHMNVSSHGFSAELLPVSDYRVPGPLAKSLVLCEFSQNNRWCRMTLGHLDQFNQIHFDSRSHKVLSNYRLISGQLFDFQCVFSFQTHILNCTYVKISRGVLGIFWDLCFFYLPFLPSFWGTWYPK